MIESKKMVVFGKITSEPRNLNEDELENLFDFELLTDDDNKILVAKTSWELNENDIVIVKYECAAIYIGIFIGYSSGRGKPMFALFDSDIRHENNIKVFAGMGFKKEYGDSIEPISLATLRVLGDYYFTKTGSICAKKSANIIGIWYKNCVERRKHKAATIIQRWYRETLFLPGIGYYYSKAIKSFQSMAIQK